MIGITNQMQTEQAKVIVQAYNNQQSNIVEVINKSDISMLMLFEYIRENNIVLKGSNLKAKKRLTFSQLTADQIKEIIRLYQDETIEAKDITAKLEISQTLLYQCLRLNSIPLRKAKIKESRYAMKLMPEQVAELIGLYNDMTIPIKKITRGFQIMPMVMYKYLKKYNVPLRSSRNERVKKELTADQIERIKALYADETIGIREVYSQLNISRGLMLRVIKENNIPLRSRKLPVRNERLTEEQVASLIHLYRDEGVKVKYLCRNFKIDLNILYRCLKEHNVLTRGREKKIRYENEFNNNLLKKDPSKMSNVYLKKRYFG